MYPDISRPSAATKRSISPGAPSTTQRTLPSASLRTHPETANRVATARAVARNPTPCTDPRNVSVRRTISTALLLPCSTALLLHYGRHLDIAPDLLHVVVLLEGIEQLLHGLGSVGI